MSANKSAYLDEKHWSVSVQESQGLEESSSNFVVGTSLGHGYIHSVTLNIKRESTPGQSKGLTQKATCTHDSSSTRDTPLVHPADLPELTYSVAHSQNVPTNTSSRLQYSTQNVEHQPRSQSSHQPQSLQQVSHSITTPLLLPRPLIYSESDPDYQAVKSAAESLHTHDYTKMANILERAPNNSIPVLFGKGLAYYKLTKYSAANRAFEQMLHESENNPELLGNVYLAHYYIGEIDLGHGRYEQASRHFEQAADAFCPLTLAKRYRIIAPSLAILYSKKGSALNHSHKVMAAVKSYKKAIELGITAKDKLAACTSLGNLYQSLGDSQNAMKQYEETIQLAVELNDFVCLGWAHGNMGNAYLGLNQKDKTLFHLEKSLELTINNESSPQAIGCAYNNLGTAHQSLGDVTKAEEYYDLALSQAIYGRDVGGQARAYGNIGNMLMIQKKFESAILHYTEAMTISKDRATKSTAFHNRGCASYEKAESDNKKFFDQLQSQSEGTPHNGLALVTYKGPKVNRLPQAPSHLPSSINDLYEPRRHKETLVLYTAKFVHLATHGSAVTGFVAFAGRGSSRSKEVVDDKKVLLYPEKLSISPALVVLSSCDSGRGVVKADGIQRMARAFILAGAQSVLTSLWRVPDESASTFMQFFYQYLMDGFKSTSALQKAILSVRAFSKYSRYIHWSGYQLTGREVCLVAKKTAADTEIREKITCNWIIDHVGNYPETDLHVQASKGNKQGCKVCGNLNIICIRQKLSTFIIKNPPNATIEDSSGKKDKKRGRDKKGGKRDKKQDSPTHTTQDGATENGDDDFLDDPPVQGFKNTGGASAVGSNVAKIKAEAEKLDLMDKAAGIMGELLFTEQMISEISDYRIILLHFVVENRKGQKYLLIGVERLVGEVFPSLLPKVAIILKAFYDNDILEEEAILEWADKVPKKHVKSDLGKVIREKAAPFVTWLRTAEEEESSDEEVEVVYSEAQAGNSLIVQEEKPPQPILAEASAIDIDAI